MSTVVSYGSEVIVRRVLDCYDRVGDILDTCDLDTWDLVEWLLEENYINEGTMPHIFNDDEDSTDE